MQYTDFFFLDSLLQNMTYRDLLELEESLPRSLTAGTQFSCFTSTKAQILTPRACPASLTNADEC
jgi:hypothetical protein